MVEVRISRLLAALWLVLCGKLFFLQAGGFRPRMALLLAFWAAVPLPAGYRAATRAVTGVNAWRIVVAGLALAFAGGAWLYWDAFLGPSSRAESLSGLVVLHGPLYQLALLAVALCAAWAIDRRTFSGA